MKKFAYIVLGLLTLFGTQALFSGIEIDTLGVFIETGEFGIRGGLGLATAGLLLPSKKNFRIPKAEIKKVEFDLEIYDESKRTGKSVEYLLNRKEEKLGFKPEANSNALKVDAIDRQLLAYGLNPNNSATLVSDFYKTEETKILLPAYINKNILAGMKLGKMDLTVEDLKASSQVIPQSSFDQVGLDFDKEKTKPARVVETAKYPTGTISTKDVPGTTEKVGITLNVTGESLRRSSVDIMSIFFQRVGFQISRQMAQKGLKTMIEGDGNTNSNAKETPIGDTEFHQKDLVDLLYNQFGEGHEATHIVLNKAMLMKILTDETNFKAFQSLNISEKFVTTGEFIPFFGCTWKVHPSVPDNTILAYEKSSCLAYYEEANSSLVDTASIIDRGMKQVAISLNYGFSKLLNGAAHVKKKP
ncbi:phage capsid protein [Leptospira yasudae]|uniref:phage capsid protein n=1 Tax=Leptospira yasudae TaxID=2202201 RepID=UPI001C4E786D|nr:phage capsid protein [Leptospira yasudae]MBW0432277.1 phage capsid protein [Leptospira yasudae]